MTDADPDPAGGSDAPGTLEDLLDELHEHLAATQERPVERTASRWIGEAEAVARDLSEADLAEDVVAERLGHVESLLAEVDGTDDEAADRHVERAAALTSAGLDRLRE